MNAIIEFLNDETRLYSGLEANGFGKTHMGQMIEENGYIGTFDGEKITFSDYKFEGTRNSSEDNVYFYGKPFSGKTLTDLLNENSVSEITLAVKVISEFAGNPEVNFNSIGAGGIIVNADEKSVLILPPELYETCAINNKTQDSKNVYAENQGKFIYKGLEKQDSWIFTRSVIAYKALSRQHPFGENDTTARQADIFDQNFLPLALNVNGINKKLAESVDAGLKIRRKEIISAGGRQFTDKKRDEIQKEFRKLAGNFDNKIFENEINSEIKPETSEEEFKVRQEKFLSNKQKITKISRIWRRNNRRILLSMAAVFAVIYGTASFQKTNGNLATSKGLDSIQTIQTAYTCISNGDVPNLQEVAKGKKIKNLITNVTGFYVMNTQRLSMNQEDGTTTPAQWLFFKKESNYWMYGITNLMIDGKSASSNIKFSRRKDKPVKITEENGRILEKNDTTTHEVEYYLIHTDSLRVNIEKHTEKVTLRWTGSKWIMVDIDGKTKATTVKLADFKKEYHNLLSENENDIQTTTATLREKYPWMPNDGDLLDGARIMLEKYDSRLAKEYLEAQKK